MKNSMEDQPLVQPSERARERRVVMCRDFQTTISGSVSLTGPALHSGGVTTVTLHPAGPNTGILWRRTDIPGSPVIEARPDNVVNTQRCTVLGSNGTVVRTVEHIMAALRGLSIDNCIIDVDGEEPPAADGSAATYVRLLQQVGTSVSTIRRKKVFLDAPVSVQDGRSSVIALPHDRLTITCVFTNDHNHPALQDQFAEYDLEPDVFVREIAPARTIGFIKEVEQLRKAGLALGGNLDIAVVVGEESILTPLRFPDEFVRHKILDLVGDLALLGHLNAHVVAIRPSHRLNTRLAREIAEQCGLYQEVTRVRS